MNLENLKYVSFHTHSIYSVLDGFSKVEKIVDRAIEIGSPAVCITDHAYATSHYLLSETCIKKGIKPIFGVEGYLSPFENEKKEKIEGYKDYYHITMIAKNSNGYKNLMKLVADSFLNGFYRKARTSVEKLERYSKDIIVLQACLGSYQSQMFLEGKDEEAYKFTSVMKEIFGERYFLELTWTKLPQQELVNPKIIKMGEDLGVKIIITPDSHYTYKEETNFHQALVCINTGTEFKPYLSENKKEGEDVDEGGMFYTPEQYYFKSAKELYDDYYHIFPNAIEYFQNTLDIANSIEWIKFDKEKKFPSPYENSLLELKNRIVSGFNLKFEKGLIDPEKKDIYLNRIKEELSIIYKMDFSDYFIEVQEIILWANSKKISTGPGRGSGAGSLINYLLGITNVDPIKHDLLFSRMLSPGRCVYPLLDILEN